MQKQTTDMLYLDRIRAIRQKIAEQECFSPESEYSDEPEDTREDRLLLHVRLSDDDLALLFQILEEKEKQCRAIIKRNTDYPTYNARALRSDLKQNALIDRIEYIRSQFTDQ